MLTKEIVNDTMNQMSPQFSVDELIDKLIFIEKIERGIQQSEKGLINTKNQAKEKLSKWLK